MQQAERNGSGAEQNGFARHEMRNQGGGAAGRGEQGRYRGGSKRETRGHAWPAQVSLLERGAAQGGGGRA